MKCVALPHAAARRRGTGSSDIAGRLQQRAVARGHHHMARLGQRRQLRPAHSVSVVQHHQLGAAALGQERAQLGDSVGGVRAIMTGRD